MQFLSALYVYLAAINVYCCTDDQIIIFHSVLLCVPGARLCATESLSSGGFWWGVSTGNGRVKICPSLTDQDQYSGVHSHPARYQGLSMFHTNNSDFDLE